MARARLPLLGDLPAFRRDRLGFLTELARSGGDAARFRLAGQELLLLSSPDLIHALLVQRAEAFAKSPVLRRARVVLGEGLLTSEGAHHRARRRLVAPALSSRRVAGHGPAFVAAASAEADGWVAGAPLDAGAAMLRITVSAAGAALCSADVDERAAGIGAAVDDVLAAYDTLFLPFPALVQRLPLPSLRRLRRGVAHLEGVVRRLVAVRRAGGEERDDVLGRLLAAGLDDRALRDEVLTLLLAGHETTASALTSALRLLAEDPGLQERLHAEVDAVLDGRLPVAADVPALAWTRGLVAEALRLHPPSWAMGRQACTALSLAGVPVAAGTVVLASQWVVHRDPRWWPEPERADPARWGPDAAPRPPLAFFPFGAGPRRCLGEAFAWTEAALTLAVLAQRWRLAPAPGARPEVRPSLTLRPTGVRVVAARRAGWLSPMGAAG